MGNWSVNIRGTGPHHNTEGDTANDADMLTADFVMALWKAGHHIESASITTGSRECLTHGKGGAPEPCAPTSPVIALLGFLCIALGASAAETTNVAKAKVESKTTNVTVVAPLPSIYQAGTFSLAGFGTYRVSDVNALDDHFGGGLEFSYFLKDKVALSLEALTDAAVDEAGVNVKRFWPVKDCPVTPYGFVGATRAFVSDDSLVRRGDWRVNLGAGLEWRTCKEFCVFGDARWTHDFDEVGHGLFRFGASLRF